MIPFNKPYVPSTSKKYALEVLESDHQQGDGPFTKQASAELSKLVGGGYVLLTPSCTHALEMASMLVNLGPGDEVILPSYTFTSAATAITQFGATPVFVDIDPFTKGIDVNQIESAITPKTKAISWVNYAGVAPDIDGIKLIASKYNLLTIEDNAHGLGGSYKGKPLGSFGDFATQSFHATKNVQCGEGGALIVNASEFVERAEVIREKGTNRSKFLTGQVEKYQWVDKGSSYLLAETLAAILLGQFEEFDEIQKSRTHTWRVYKDQLVDQLILQSDWSDHGEVAHMFYIESPNLDARSELLQYFKSNGVQTTFHYQPLEISIAGEHFGRHTKPLPFANKISDTIIRLPLWYGMSEKFQRKVIDVYREAQVQVL